MSQIMTREQRDDWYYRNIDVKNRTLYFGAWQGNEELVESRAWEVDDYSAQNLIKGLYILDRSKRSTITVLWLSYGGDWGMGMAIFDTIKRLRSPVIIKAYGRIRSMGTIILQACKKRFLSPNCEFLLHYGTAAFGEEDSRHIKDGINFMKECEKNNAIMEWIYIKRIREKHPKFKIKDLQTLIEHDRYMSPRQAVDIGLADSIIK